MYRAPLRFEVEERSDATGKISFVDKELIATWDRLLIIRKDPNKNFVIGLDSKPVKIRYPEFLGHGFLRPRKIRSWLRATMYSELSTECPEQQRLGTLRCVAELQLLGHPNQVLKKMVAGITQRPLRRLRGVAQRYLRASKAKYGFGEMERQGAHEEMMDLHLRNEVSWQLLAETARAEE